MKTSEKESFLNRSQHIRKKWFLLPLMGILLLNGCEKSIWPEKKPELLIGVMLPYSGEMTAGWDSALDWAVENINVHGGVAGRYIRLVKHDIAGKPLEDAVDQLSSDPEMKAVIGPLTSAEVFRAAPAFINVRIPMLAPVATSADISRAFAGKDYFWRLTEPDISQTKTLLLLAQSGGARSVALLTEESRYGASFEDWFGYFATELGLEVTGIEVIEPDDTLACHQSWDHLIQKHPDAIISALNASDQNVAVVNSFRNNGQQTRLLLSDAACFQSLIDRLGPLSENIEGLTVSADPASGFDLSYKVRYGKYPEAFLAHMYDAVILLALALEISEGEGGAELTDALKKLVQVKPDKTGWQRDEIGKALKMIREGQIPDIRGASGQLDYDELYYTDVTSSTYGHWRVDGGEFVTTAFYTSDGSGRVSSTSAAYRIIANERQQFSDQGNWPALELKTGNYALLLAASRGWHNYRHQADVLNSYQLLKQNGFTDDHIILILEDDLASSSNNPRTGQIINEPEGENLYHDLEIDYHLSSINSQLLTKILNGEKSAETPVVMESGPGDNVFFFTSGHGSPEGMILEGQPMETLRPSFWADAFDQMQQQQKFRQIFWSFEACYSGNIGEEISTPGVLLMTGANPFETSKAHFYVSDLKSWVADKFAYSVNKAIAENPDIRFHELYEKSWTYVNGSHVSFYNYQNFGNIYEIKLSEFIRP